MSDTTHLYQRQASPATQSSSSLPDTLPDTVPAELLFRGKQEILIRHNGEHYRLRITKSGKLILTK
ncbi:MAG: hemin uptake protein HemP [Thiobacillus sp.]